MKAACVSTWGPPKKYFHQFIASARRNGIEPHNADPDTWAGDDWRTIPWWRKSAAQARFVREHADQFDAIMFVDSYDILFAAGWDEIIAKFDAIGSPIVFAAECNPWPKPEQADLYPAAPYRCRYLNAGFWMGRTEAVLKVVEPLEQRALLKEQCDQGIVVDMFLSGQHGIELDRSCSLCHCCNLDSLNFLHLSGDRIRNKETGEAPCLFHGNGNANMSQIVAWLKL